MEEFGCRVSENEVLWMIRGHKMDEVTEACIQLHNERFLKLFPWPSIGQVIESRKDKNGEEKQEIHAQFWSEYLKERSHLGDVDVDRRY
jgi:hypothetical protein